MRCVKNKSDMNTLRFISEVSGRNKIYIVILLLVQVLLGISGVIYAVILRDVIDTAVDGDRGQFFFAVARLVLLVVTQIVLRAVNRHLEEYSKSTMENSFKRRLYANLLHNDYEQVTFTHSGEWMNRLTSDTVVVADGLAQIVPGVAGMIVKMIGALIMILILEPRFGYILVPGGVLLIILTYAFRKVLKKLHKNMQEADGRLRVYMQESLASMLVVRAFVKEEQTLLEASKRMEEHKNARMRKNRFSNVCNIGFGGVMQGAYVFGAGMCGYGILTGAMSYGTLMAVLQLIGQIQAPFANITGYLPKYYAMLASAERIREIEVDLAESESLKCIDKTEIMELGEVKKFYEEQLDKIMLERAYFTYKPRANEDKDSMLVVLKDVSMSIDRGEYVAFTGLSGCGKSTVLKIMMCLYPLDKGGCYMRTKKGEKIPLSYIYRRLFAYVPQGNHLMSGTIREIIAYSQDSKCQDTDRIKRALKIACADEFVSELPDGIDTVLGERGIGISEGQMQRIAIARAIYSDNPVLMLDEATSALDETTEKKLLINLRKMTDKTVLIVTHRLAVLAICDKEVVYSEDGCSVKFACERIKKTDGE